MAEKNRSTLNSDFDSNITTNGVGDISGADLNTAFGDTADSAWNKVDEPQVSGAEITAGTSTSLKMYSPADIVAIIAEHEAGEANPSQVSGGEIAAGTETATRLYSPADIVAIIAEHETGEANPTQVSGGEITAGTETAERSFSPANVKSMIDTHGSSGGGLEVFFVNKTSTQAVSSGSFVNITGYNSATVSQSWGTFNSTNGTITLTSDGTYMVQLTVALQLTGATNDYNYEIGISVGGSDVGYSARAAHMKDPAFYQSIFTTAIATRSGSNVIVVGRARRIDGSDTMNVLRSVLIIQKLA